MSEPRIVAKLRTYFPGVDRVADGAGDIRVTVTPADCSKGARGDGESCAMARACKRELKCDGILIWNSIAWVVKGNLATKYMVPASLAKEVAIFDRGADFMPGEYHLSHVPESAKLKDRERLRKGKGGKNKGRSRTPRAYHKTGGVRMATAKV